MGWAPSLKDLPAWDRALQEGEEILLTPSLWRELSTPRERWLPLFDRLASGDWAGPPPQLPSTAAGAPPERPLVTAVIPTHRQTPLGLEMLRRQTCGVEVLVLSNGEARPEGDRVLEVPWRGHGRTRQLGVTCCQTPYVLLTVDDALPRGRGMVSRMIEVLEEGEYDAVWARQVPWPSASELTRQRLSQWCPPGQSARQTPQVDHVCALYRRETLLAQPLPDVPIAEDLCWSQGRRIGYVPDAVVVHSHRRSPRALYRRNRDIHRQHLLLGEPAAVPSSAHLLRGAAGLILQTPRLGPRELSCQLSELLGQWRAVKMVRTQPKP